MQVYDTVIFDLDGTLFDSKINYERMSQLIIDVLLANGMTEPLEDRRKVYRVIRGGESTLLEYGLNPDNVPETLIQMEKVMNQVELEALGTIKLKPNAKKILVSLQNQGFKRGIATRSHREYAVRGLDATGLLPYIEVIVGRDEVPYPKPDPRHLFQTIELLDTRPDRVLFIGDTTTDFHTAQAAKVNFLGYKRDEVWAKRLIEAGCETIVEDLMEILEYVNGEKLL
jgi:HAD superfamily hydrolase (TIGR01549 family)